jgi:hypothetical protein
MSPDLGVGLRAGPKRWNPDPVGTGPRLIPCPICGGELRYDRWPLLDGPGLTPLMVDCEQRDRATTPPHVYEDARLATLLREVERELAALRVKA